MITPACHRRQGQSSPSMRARQSPSDRRPWQDESVLSLVKSTEPAPIDMAAFGKTLGEIINKSVGASRKRQKSRK